jgi:glycerol uptake facilitator protein
MSYFMSEVLGTALLVYLGDACVANVILKGTKGNGSGWTVITLGWAFAVGIPVLIFGPIGGAHFNPAVTLGLASVGITPWALVPGYIVAQFIGAFIGAFLVWLQYKEHLDITEDQGCKLGVFATGPAIRSYGRNVISEFLGTFTLVFTILGIGQSFAGTTPDGVALKALCVAAIILVIGLCLGGTTGYALNPARCLGPRIMHALLPIKGKGGSDWGYSWVTVVGPILGGVCAALFAQAVGLV